MQDTYSNKKALNSQNQKALGTPIINYDPCCGCNNSCKECFAAYGAARTIRKFNVPVLVTEVTGKMNPKYVYRLGNKGDPAYNWEHTEKTIREHKLYRSFIVTKLQSIEGYTGLIKKLQVSVDLFNEEHFYKTLSNVTQLLDNFEGMEIVLRIRSISTVNPRLISLMNEAVKYANQHGLIVLETRIRFKKKNTPIKEWSLVEENYEYKRGFLRPNNGVKFLEDVKRHYVCDFSGKKCAGCLNCLKLFGFRKNAAF